ncbi:C40 family peptidase [Halpernia frigidisoli]|uniref:NlpC/P60 family protein n=1 Tax=Halpernia frigidisoli TaxID=1125876 RepID=A0A1I3CUH3_9FLAO|nr:C40 family peptidase [Halpernia frigidisoli]SFH78073.1 NlpC/P60 family protein [Halpernia frigidisoli]
MKKILFLLPLILFLASCGSSSKVVKRTPYKKSVVKEEGLKTFNSTFRGALDARRNELLKDSEKYIGAPYKYGGNTSSGFDCSGYTVKVFTENNENLPRRSQDQAQAGESVSVRQVEPGDLVFFATAGGNNVTHVGIVHDIGDDGEIKFIHASTSKGVMISSLNEKYWNKAFLFARRVL